MPAYRPQQIAAHEITPEAIFMNRRMFMGTAAGGLLAADARVYVESRAREPLPPLPAGWRAIREGRAGEVGYHLLAS